MVLVLMMMRRRRRRRRRRRWRRRRRRRRRRISRRRRQCTCTGALWSNSQDPHRLVAAAPAPADREPGGAPAPTACDWWPAAAVTPHIGPRRVYMEYDKL
jgi:hypothetical protein